MGGPASPCDSVSLLAACIAADSAGRENSPLALVLCSWYRDPRRCNTAAVAAMRRRTQVSTVDGCPKLLQRLTARLSAASEAGSAASLASCCRLTGSTPTVLWRCVKAGERCCPATQLAFIMHHEAGRLPPTSQTIIRRRPVPPIGNAAGIYDDTHPECCLPGNISCGVSPTDLTVRCCNFSMYSTSVTILESRPSVCASLLTWTQPASIQLWHPLESTCEHIPRNWGFPSRELHKFCAHGSSHAVMLAHDNLL